MTTVLVQVPISDGAELTKLSGDVQADGEPFQSRPFDGETVWQLAVAASTISIPVLRTWIRARAESRSSYRVVIDGVEMTGYTPAEVSKILDRIDGLGPRDDDPTQGD